MHPVDHQVEVCVVSVVVRDREHLIFGQLQIVQQAARYFQHEWAARAVRRVEAHGEVIDGRRCG
jgi:hypothetical protein